MPKYKEDCFAFMKRKDKCSCVELKKLECAGCKFYKTKKEVSEHGNLRYSESNA